MLNFVSSPSRLRSGDCNVPGDKSISHRALMLAAIATGESVIKKPLTSDDCLKTRDALKAMGVTIVEHEAKTVVSGVGIEGLTKPHHALDMGNAGTAMRLFSGLLAAQSFDSCLVGDASLSKRPMGRVIKPLTTMGAMIQSNDNRAPLVISGGKSLQAITYQMPKASAQVKSAILIAGLYATGETVVIEPHITRDHTERMLKSFGVNVTTKSNMIRLSGHKQLHATDIDVPGDFSSAAFFIVAALVSKQTVLTIKEVGINRTRIGLLHLLTKMGASIELSNKRFYQHEDVADITVYPSKLHGIDVMADDVALAIDEFPIFFIAASLAQGTTTVRGASELRVKESDRLHMMAKGLIQLGIAVKEHDDGIEIDGGELEGGEVESGGDHRIAMAFCIAGCFAKDAIIIKDCDNISTSFPGFADLACKLGLKLATTR